MELTDPKLKGYRVRGLLDGFENDRFWRDTFVGAFASKLPTRVRLIEVLQMVLDGKRPEWSDITDTNLRELKRVFIDNNIVCSSSLCVMFNEFKALLNEYKKEKNIPSENYSTILKVKSRTSQAICFTEDELDNLFKYKPKSIIEKYVKKITLIQCYTGMRLSDAKCVSMANVSEGILSYVSKKTHTKVDIPVHVNLPSLLMDDTKVEIRDEVFNKTLRKICCKIGMNDVIKLYRKCKVEVAEKWHFVSSHTSRRTFASLLHLHEVDIYTICKLAGHSNIEMTQKYIVTERAFSENALSFFNNIPIKDGH